MKAQLFPYLLSLKEKLLLSTTAKMLDITFEPGFKPGTMKLFSCKPAEAEMGSDKMLSFTFPNIHKLVTDTAARVYPLFHTHTKVEIHYEVCYHTTPEYVQTPKGAATV